MDKSFKCYECDSLQKPYMIQRLGSRFIALCSVLCGMKHYITNDLKIDNTYRFKASADWIQAEHDRQLDNESGYIYDDGDTAMNEVRDQYLKKKIIESGVAPEGVIGLDFSTWDGFGYLVKWATQQDWWEEFSHEEFEFGLQLNAVTSRMLDPEVMSDELWKFL